MPNFDCRDVASYPRLARQYYCDSLSELPRLSDLECLCRDAEDRLYRSHWGHVIELFHLLPTLEVLEERSPVSIDTTSDVISIGQSGLLTDAEMILLERLVTCLKPWRKGPFDLFGLFVDAEWRSEKKWHRIRPMLGDLNGLKIADVGCGNGYYMLRLREFNPKLVVGLDPSEQFWFMFSLFQRYVSDARLQYQLLGVQHLEFYPEYFDLILCMGVLYHQRDPLTMVRWLYNSLAPGGQVIVETMAISGDSPVALCPAERFASMRNVYFVPSAKALVNWLDRVGFEEIVVFSQTIVSGEEQRCTQYGPVQSLSDYLNPLDPSLTIEGYPAPIRIAVKARKAW